VSVDDADSGYQVVFPLSSAVAQPFFKLTHPTASFRDVRETEAEMLSRDVLLAIGSW
jgi:hypothetical protein